VPFFILTANQEGVKPSVTVMNAGDCRLAMARANGINPPMAGMKSAYFVALKNTNRTYSYGQNCFPSVS